MKYKFTIQYCATTTENPEAMLRCEFDAPNEERADALFDSICKDFANTGTIAANGRTYEHVREWKRKL